MKRKKKKCHWGNENGMIMNGKKSGLFYGFLMDENLGGLVEQDREESQGSK